MEKRNGVRRMVVRSAGAALVGLSIPWLMWLLESHHQPWTWEAAESGVFLCVFALVVGVAAVSRARKSDE